MIKEAIRGRRSIAKLSLESLIVHLEGILKLTISFAPVNLNCEGISEISFLRVNCIYTIFMTHSPAKKCYKYINQIIHLLPI